jgi:hypothetical protein
MCKRNLSVPDKRLSVLISAEQQKRIDEWRRQQPDLPILSEAIRRLLDLALKEKKKKTAIDT